jgi:hypothetical protein
MIPIDVGRKYRSATEAGIGVGSAVAACASSTLIAVTAAESLHSLSFTYLVLAFYVKKPAAQKLSL